MNTITTTNLRTQTAKLIETLKKGGVVTLTYRSKVIGVIEPVPSEKKVFNVKKFRKLVKLNNLPKMSYAEREKRYRQHIEEKYGKNRSK